MESKDNRDRDVRDIRHLKDAVQEIEIPDKLDLVIRRSIKRGVKKMKKIRTMNRMMYTAAAVLLLFTSFVASINMVPAFAAQVENLPGGSSIVKLLQFNRSTVEGGEVTEGKDIKDITNEKPSESGDNNQNNNGSQTEYKKEVIRIALGEGEGNDSALSIYEITYLEYPYSAIVYFSGVRAFSAADVLADIGGGPLVRNAYRLINLDDSAHRFAINFNSPVKIEVTEDKDAAALILSITETPAINGEVVVYSVRSTSLPFGEKVGAIEQILFYEYGAENARIIQDAAGTYLTEEGYYASMEEAQTRIDELKAAGFTYDLLIEPRTPGQIPEAME